MIGNHYRTSKRSFILAFAALLVISYWIYVLFRFSQGEQAYQEVMQKANPLHSYQGDAGYRAQQMRCGVKKDIWYQKKAGERLHASLESMDSELIFIKRGDTKEIVESMRKFKGYLQESLHHTKEGRPMQNIWCIEAERATYNYSTYRLEAEEVTLCYYTVPGHELITSFEKAIPTMHAVAESVDMHLLSKASPMKAYQLKAVYHQ